MKNRVTIEEISNTTEMFVNSIYDDPQSDWATATEDEWVEAVYEEITNWKAYDHGYARSNENRFDGKDNLQKRIRTFIRSRMIELREEGLIG